MWRKAGREPEGVATVEADEGGSKSEREGEGGRTGVD